MPDNFLNVNTRGSSSPIARLQYGSLRDENPLRGMTMLRRGLSGFGSTQNTVTGASTGAKAGSLIVPVIGTAIGAILGGVLGAAIKTGQKPQRAAQAQADFAALQQLPDTFAGRQLDEHTLNMLVRALFILNHLSAPSDPAAHPSAMDGFYTASSKIVKYLVQQMALAAPGQTITTTIPVATAPNGHWPSAEVTFVNPGLADASRAFNQGVLPGLLAVLHKVEGTAYDKFWQDPYTQKVYKLITDYFIGQLLPTSISSPAPIGASPIATVAPPLQYYTGPAAPQAPISTTGLPSIPVQVPTAAGPVTSMVPPPAITASGVDVNSMVQALMAQGASQQQAFTAAMSALGQQGVAPSAPVQAQVAAQVAAAPATAGLSGNMALWIGGGLAVLAVMFALARPKSGGPSTSALRLK